MKILVDMNLSPDWCEALARHGHQALHWSDVGDPQAADTTIMAHARTFGQVVFTHDLDFGAILATTQAKGPSVIQVRTQDVTPEHLASLIASALRQFEDLLQGGALIVIDEARMRARVLPLTQARP